MGQSVLNNTISDELANSYCDVPYADTYWTSDYRASLVSQWAALTDGQKTGALIDACRIIESVRFTLPFNLRDYVLFYDRRTRMVRIVDRDRQPFKFEFKQRLQFPRNLDIYTFDPPSPDLLGQPYIPPELMDAQCEQAMFLLTFDESIMQSRMQGVQSESVGLGKQALTTNTRYGNSTPTMLAPRALERIKPFMLKTSRWQRS